MSREGVGVQEASRRNRSGRQSTKNAERKDCSKTSADSSATDDGETVTPRARRTLGEILLLTVFLILVFVATNKFERVKTRVFHAHTYKLAFYFTAVRTPLSVDF